MTTHDYGCGTAADAPAAQVACVGSALSAVHDPGGLDLTYTYTYDADGFGGVRLVSATPPDGGEATVYEFWGPDETAAGLPNADQLGDLVAVPQRGLPKTTTLPGGRSTTTVHDDYGTPLCQQVDGGNWTCTTLDVTRRPVTHVVRANQAGVAAVTISTDYAPAGNPLINRTTRSDTTGATTTDQTVLAPSGRVLEYTDTLNTVTGYRYDGMGRLSSTTITPPAAPGRKARPRPLGVTAGFTTTVTFDPATGLQTGVSLQGQPLVGVAYNNPDHRWLPTGYTYTLAGGAPSPPRSTTTRISTRSGGPGRSPTAANCWTVPPPRPAPTACTAAVGDTQPGTTASGRTLARTVDGHPHQFTYDAARRLTAAQVGATGYGYTWDAVNNLTAKTVTGPVTESFTYTFNPANQLVATSDPQAAIPATGAFDADANHTAIGADTYTYDALHQLAAVTDTDHRHHHHVHP